jgi:hypothetical protein
MSEPVPPLSLYEYISIYYCQNTTIKLSNDYHYTTCFDPVGVIVRSLQRAENHLVYNIKYRIVLGRTGSHVVYNM